MSKEKKQREITLGSRAEIALEELNAAFEALEDDVLDAFKSSDVHDIEGHMACRMYLRVMEDIKDRFKLYVYNGEAARRELVRLGEENPTH